MVFRLLRLWPSVTLETMGPYCFSGPVATAAVRHLCVFLRGDRGSGGGLFLFPRTRNPRNEEYFKQLPISRVHLRFTIAVRRCVPRVDAVNMWICLMSSNSCCPKVKGYVSWWYQLAAKQNRCMIFAKHVDTRNMNRA